MSKAKSVTATAVPVHEVQIKAPNIQTAQIGIVGTAPYMQAKFSQKCISIIEAKHKAGSQANKGKKREARDFDADYRGAMYKSREGWHGIPASAFRNAMISACRLCGFKMTLGKLSVFVEADGFDYEDSTPLIKITGKPKMDVRHARNASGVCDLRARPLWNEWSATVRVRYDADQMSLEDICNLMARVGLQVGIGEGRPDSRDSNGLGFGLFNITGSKS